MTSEQIEIYLKSIDFKLKDYNKTYNKYVNYKNDKFNEFLENECLDNNLTDYQKSKFYNIAEHILYDTNYTLELIYKKDKSKSDIRLLKTCINNSVKEAIYEMFNGYDYNDNEKKNFTIKLYLYYYDIINNIMLELLKDTCIEIN